jgi:hypothetical protein
MEQLLLSGILAIQAEKKLDRPSSDGSTATVGAIKKMETTRGK